MHFYIFIYVYVCCRTRVVQKLVDCIAPDQQYLIISALSRITVALTKSDNGNHVIKKCFADFAPQVNKVSACLTFVYFLCIGKAFYWKSWICLLVLIWMSDELIDFMHMIIMYWRHQSTYVLGFTKSEIVCLLFCASLGFVGL